MPINATIDVSNTITLKSGYNALTEPPLLRVQHKTSLGSDGGAYSPVSNWVVRPINTTVTNTISGASLGTNQIVLPAGTYFVDCVFYTYNVASGQGRLYDTTASATILRSANFHNEKNNTSYRRHVPVYILGKFTLNVSSTLQIEMVAYDAGTGSDHMGKSATLSTGDVNWGTNPTPVNIFLDAYFYKIG